MKNDIMKFSLIVLGIVAAILGIVFGSYQPFVKSQVFIKALRNQGNLKTFDEFTRNFDRAFDSPSQIGNEELTKFLSDNVIPLISSQNQGEDVSGALVAYMDPHIFRSDVRQLLAYGDMRATLFQRFHKEADFKRAEESYLRAFAIGPKLPPVLYGMLDLYSMARDIENFKKIGGIAISYWPDDARLKGFLESLNSPTSAAPVLK